MWNPKTKSCGKNTNVRKNIKDVDGKTGKKRKTRKSKGDYDLGTLDAMVKSSWDSLLWIINIEL